jgi:hypothetical protein
MEQLTLAAMKLLPTAVIYVLDFSGQAGDKYPGGVVWVWHCESWVVGLIPTQYVVPVCGQMAENCFLSTRFGGHHWQMEEWSRILQLADYVNSRPILWDGVVWFLV